MKKFITYILTGVLLIVSYSCDKQLSALPENAKVNGTAIIDEQSAQIALNGVYNRLANISSDNVTQWVNHSVYPEYFSGYLGNGTGQVSQEENVNTAGIADCWRESYATINAANGVIESIETINDNLLTGNRKQEIIGESKFLRAYSHFRILTYYAEWYDINSEYGILVRDQFSTLSNIQKARGNVAESFQFILDDLDYAIDNAPANNPSHFVTKWAAMALKMKVLMNRGTQTDYTEIITLANTIIQNSPYVLENSVKDIFWTLGLNSNEVILGIMPQPNQEEYYYILSRQFYPSASSLYVAKKALKDLLVNDPRDSWMVGTTTPYQSQSPDTYYFTKFIEQETSPTQISETSYILRLSEVYLLKAEAIIRSGGSLTDAKTLIKTIMGNAGVTDFSDIDNANTTDELLLQTFYETVRSLVGEDGADWMALLRLPFETVMQIKPTITSKIQYIFPVPSNEFQNNPLFGDQNPGYPKPL